MQRVKRVLTRMIDAMELPANPLDQLTELLGGETAVAEMTGRKGLLRRKENGKVEYVQRCAEESQKLVNLAEKTAFMDKRKVIASEYEGCGGCGKGGCGVCRSEPEAGEPG